MKRWLWTILMLAVPLSCLAQNTQLTGTVHIPNGATFTGTMYLALPSPGAGLTGGSCSGGPTQVVPNVTIPVQIEAGSMVAAPKVWGADCMLPAGIPYKITFRDTNGNTIWTDQWLIYGTTYDIGTAVSAVVPILYTSVPINGGYYVGPVTIPTLTISGIGSGQCLQTSIGGLVVGTGAPCGSGGGGGATALSGLSDVNVTEGAGIDGYSLVWNNASSKWIASSVSGGAGAGTVTVVGAGALTANALVTGGGTTTLQTPSTTSTLDSGGNLILAAGGTLGSADSGTPKFTFSTSKIASNAPLSINTTSNQIVLGSPTTTTLSFAAPLASVTVLGPNVASGLVYATSAPAAGLAKFAGSTYAIGSGVAYTDIVGLWSLCSGYLKSDGTCGSGPLSSLSDVNVTEGAPIDGYSLTWNNSVAKWVATSIGTGPGSQFTPSDGGGLNIVFAGGKIYCNGSLVTTGPALIGLGTSRTEYFYLNPASSCAITGSLSSFTGNVIPLATVVTGGSSISALTDNRPLYVTTGSGASALSGLSDVNVTEGAGIDGYVLTWNNSTSKWIALSAAAGMVWPGTSGITVCTGTPCTAWGSSLTPPTGSLVGAGQANTYSTGLQDFSSATMKLPSSVTVGANSITMPASAGTVALTSQIPAASQWTSSGSDIYYNSAGHVGIGMTPTYTLDVNGDIRIPNNYAVYSNDNASHPAPMFSFNSSNQLVIGGWEGNYVGDTVVKGGNGNVYADFSQGNSAKFIVREVSGTTPTELFRVATGGQVSITATTNQLVLGTTNTTTLDFEAPVSSVTVTAPNVASGLVYATSQPASGLAKFAGSTYAITSGVTYSDVVGLWTTCSGYLKSGGTCDNPPGTYTLPSTVVQTNQANTYSTGLQDFSSATMKQPTSYTVGANSITNPSSAGTLALTGQLPSTLASASHKFFTSYTAGTETFTSAQPACGDLSDSGSGCSSAAYSLPSTVVQTNQANTYSSGLQDFSSATMKTPTSITVGSNSITMPSSAGTIALVSQINAGTVTSSSSPAIHQLAVFTAATDIKGVAVGSTDKVLVGVTSGDPVWSKVTVTNPATAATLTIADNKTLTATNTMDVSKTAGVAGAIPWYDTTTSQSASALLAQYGVMIGGGASNAPSTISASTTTTQALFATAAAPAFRGIAYGDLPTGTGSNQVVLGGAITAGGPTGSATAIPVITYNAAGQLTTVTTATPTVTVVGGKSLAGSGTGITTGPTSTTANDCVKFADTAGTIADAGASCGSGAGTVSVVSSGTLTSTALVTGGGTTLVQTPSATTTLDASGNLAVAAGGSLGSADSGTPKFSFATNKITANQPVVLGTTSNQLVTGTSTNLTTLTFPASSGAVTLTFPNTTEYVVGAAGDTTTSHVLHATATNGVGAFSAIAYTDLPTGTGSNQVVLGGAITAGGPTGSSTVIPVITYNAAGQLTTVSTATPTVSTMQGGTTGQILYQGSANSTSFVSPSSWTTGHTFVPVWQPSGSALAPVSVDANTLVVASVGHALTANNGGSGTASGMTFDGSADKTISYNTIGAPGLAASNTFSGASTNDFSGTSQIKMPVATSFATLANGEIGFDTTANNWHVWNGSADVLVATMPTAGLVNGHCVGFVLTSFAWSIADGGPCWSASGSNAYYSAGNVGIGTSSGLTSALTVLGNISVQYSASTTSALISTYQNASSTGQNVYIGGGGQSSSYTSGHTAYGSFNAALGYQALNANTTGFANTAIGNIALLAITSGHDNTGLGYAALYQATTSSSNTAVGSSALGSFVTGSNNSAFGLNALGATTSGASNTAMGWNAGGSTQATGSYNTFIGYGTDVASDPFSYSTAVGYNASVTASHQVVLGDSTVTQLLVPGVKASGSTSCLQIDSTGVITNTGSACGSGAGTVSVVGAGSLTSTALVTGGGSTTLQTPSATSTLDASGNLAVAAGGSVGSADTGAPKFTFAANKITANQPLNLGTASNQLVTGTSTNLTTSTYPASSGAVTLTFPNTTEYMIGAAGDTTTSHVLHATAANGIGAFGAIAYTDLPTGTSSTTVVLGGTITAGGPTGGTTSIPVITYNAAGQLTTVTTAVPAVSSVNGVSFGSAAAGQIPNATSSSASSWTATPTLGAAGTLGSITMGNATSGLLTLEPNTGALGTITVYIPAASGDVLVAESASDTTTSHVLHATASTGIGTFSAIAYTDLPTGTGSNQVVLGGAISAGGPTGGATSIPVITYNAAGQLTTVTTATPTVTVVGGKGLAGSGTGLTTGPTSGTSTNDCVEFADTSGTIADAGAACNSGTVTTSGSPAIHQVAIFSSATAVTGVTVGATDHPLVGVSSNDPVFSKVVLTNPATAATLTISDNQTLSATNTMNVSKAVGVAGAIPWYDTTTSMTATALLTQYGVMVGGGSGAAPNTISVPAADAVLYGTTGANPAFKAMPTTGTNGCDGTTDMLQFNTTTHVFSCGTAGVGTVTGAAQYDVTYYSAAGTATTLNGAAISGFVYASTSGIPAAATATNLGTLASLTQYNLVYSGGTSSALTSITAPASNGFYFAGYNVTGSAALAPTATLSTSLPAGTAIGSADTGTPKFTFGTSKITSNVPVTIGAAGTLGTLVLGNATSGLLSIQPTTGAITSYAIGLPVAQPTSGNTYLSCSAANPTVCTWTAGATGTTTSGSPAQYQLAVFSSASAITGLTAGTTDHPLVGVTSGNPAWSKVTLTNPATGVTLTISDNQTLSDTYTMNVSKTAGVAGAIPWYDTTTSESASALLTQYGVMIGGGASAAPSTISAATTTTYALFATATAPAFRAIAATDMPAPTHTVSSGSIGTITGNNVYVSCTTTCNLTPKTPAAGIQLCVRNAPGSATVITLNAMGASTYYELTTHAGWGTANHTLVSGGVATDAICLVGYDATHYEVFSYNGTWTD